MTKSDKCPLCKTRYKFNEDLAFTKFRCSGCNTELFWNDYHDKDENQMFYLVIEALMVHMVFEIKVAQPSLGAVLY